MKLSTQNSRLILILCILICISLLMGGCSVLSGPVDPDDPDGQYTSQEQALGSDNIEPIALACPSKMEEFVLFLSHSWDFSPNRDLELMKINGQTAESSPCPFSVSGSTVIMEECLVPITNTGFIQTDNGKCDISASGEALVSIEGASCSDGVITMTIVETINPDSGTGAMNCPETSQPYFPFFPFTSTTRDFPIQIGGTEASDSADPDLSGQFKYDKSWTIHGETMGSPLPGD